MKHDTISPAEAADRVAIRELIECVRTLRRSSGRKGQMVLLHDGHAFCGLHERQGRDAINGFAVARGIGPGLCGSERYDATTHFVGQATILTLPDDEATGEAYCLAHHVTVDGTKRRVMIASLRYLDTFRKDRRRVAFLGTPLVRRLG